jgi:predicted DNA-binding protein (MmcQ/YjbR family)
MELKQVAGYLLSKKGATEETPFGPEALVYKVMGKMFALVAWQAEPLQISLKCEPGQAMFLRDIYPRRAPRLPHEQDPLEHGYARRHRAR